MEACTAFRAYTAFGTVLLWKPAPPAPLLVLPSGLRKLVELRFSKDAMHLQGLYCFQGCTAPLWVLPSGFRKLVGLRFSKDAMHLQGLYRLQGCSAPILVLTSCRLQKRTALKAMLRRSTRFWFLPSGLRKLVEASLLERCNAPSGLILLSGLYCSALGSAFGVCTALKACSPDPLLVFALAN